MGGNGGIRAGVTMGTLESAYIMWEEGHRVGCTTEKTSSDSTVSYYTEGQ